MKISLIAALGKNRVIGHQGALPWNLPRDMSHFRRVTMGHPVVMGRKTYESIGRLLPDRKNIIVTRQRGYRVLGGTVVNSLDAALAAAGRSEEIFIIGGGVLYRESLPRADRLYLTIIDQDFMGDTVFPWYDESGWQMISREDFEPDQDNLYALSFRVYERKRA